MLFCGGGCCCFCWAAFCCRWRLLTHIEWWQMQVRFFLYSSNWFDMLWNVDLKGHVLLILMILGRRRWIVNIDAMKLWMLTNYTVRKLDKKTNWLLFKWIQSMCRSLLYVSWYTDLILVRKLFKLKQDWKIAFILVLFCNPWNWNKSDIFNKN